MEFSLAGTYSQSALKAGAGSLNSVPSTLGGYCRVLHGGVSDEICSQNPPRLLCGGWQVDRQWWKQKDPLEGSGASGDLLRGGRSLVWVLPKVLVEERILLVQESTKNPGMNV